MYDVQTILSAYDKQGTLVQWLKNLDETLKTSGLESVNTIPVEGGYKLQFKFANGVTLESDLIQKINNLSILADSVNLALTDENGITVEYNTTLTVNNENVESNIKILFPIKGSESVIVDVDENDTAIEIHLDADILNDINRALKTPLANPSATELVAIDANGAQTMLEIGQGLKVEAGILEAESTGGGGGLTKTKVTLAELQAMMTAENAGSLVTMIPKSIDSFILTQSPINLTIFDFGSLQSGTPTYAIYQNLSFITDTDILNTETIVYFAKLVIGILSENVILSLQYININNNGTITITEEDKTSLLNDTNFDFYIYK